MSIKERIKLYAESKNLNTTSIERMCRMSKGSFRNSKSMSSDSVACFLENNPELSAEWLMRGEGEMLRPQMPFTTPKEDIKVEPKKFNYADLFAGIGGFEIKDDFTKPSMIDQKLGAYVRRCLENETEQEKKDRTVVMFEQLIARMDRIGKLDDRVEKLEQLLEHKNQKEKQ